MNPSLGWDDTIKPQFTTQEYISLAKSPENRKKRRYDDTNAVSKRTRTSAPKAAFGRIAGVRRRLEPLSHNQLVDLVEKLVDSQPDLAQLVDMAAPPLTVAQALNVLHNYLTAIFDKMPLGSSFNEYAFLRVRPQWVDFFAALADYLSLFTSPPTRKQSMELDQDVVQTKIITALEFLDGATSILMQLPEWESQHNNTLLLRAFNQLSILWSAVLDEGSKSVSFAVMTRAFWDQKFQQRCEESKGRLTDNRLKNFFSSQPVCQSIMS